MLKFLNFTVTPSVLKQPTLYSLVPPGIDIISSGCLFFGVFELRSSATKTIYVNSLVYLSRYFKKKRNADKYKPFKEMTREDVYTSNPLETSAYLQSPRKDDKKDPDQKWINTYKARGANYLAFFRWLTKPGVDDEGRARKPPQLKGYKPPHRKIFHSVKLEDHWTPEEHEVFLMYCHDLRLKCYHWIAMEVPSRPGELLALKIRDFHEIKSTTLGKTRAEFEIGRYGKNRTPKGDYSVTYQTFDDIRFPIPNTNSKRCKKVKEVIQLVKMLLSEQDEKSTLANEKRLNSTIFDLFDLSESVRKK